MDITFTGKENIERGLDGIGGEVRRSLDCAWKDPVQESFYGYAEETARGGNKVKEVLRELENVKRSLESVDFDELAARLVRLAQEANGV